jgi:hypothetical protein
MASSISRSDPGAARAATLVATAAATWAACGLYTLFLNPEVTHYAGGAAIKHAWAERMTREQGAKVVAIGGSSCEFSFDGERLLRRHGLALVNYGWQAGVGAAVMVESALPELRPGDTLVVAIEPVLLTAPQSQPSLGVQLSVAAHHVEWVERPALGVGRVGWFDVLTALRPGAYHTFTLLGKIARRVPLYRYSLSDYHLSGWKQTAVRLPIDGPAWHRVALSDDSRRLLRNLRDWCDRHAVRVAYSLPWSYTPPQARDRFRQDNLDFLLQVAAFLPILRDARLGVDTELAHYADTQFHLNERGAALRSDELASQITHWDVWLPGELQAMK